jgi:hypothetical protein
MTTRAAEIQNAAPNPQWKAMDGSVYYVLDPTQSVRTVTPGDRPETGTRKDYWRRAGRWGRRWGLGPLGFRFAVQKSAGNYVSLATDSVEASLTTPPTVQHPPAGTSG